MNTTIKRVLQTAAGLIALLVISFVILVLINGKSSDELTNLRSETEGVWEEGTENMELSFEGTTVSVDVPVGYYAVSDYEDADGEYNTEKVIYKDEGLMINLYLWKNSSDAQSDNTGIEDDGKKYGYERTDKTYGGNSYDMKNCGNEINADIWISKINAGYYDDGTDHVQTMTVDGREVSYISVMEAAAPEDELMYEDSTEAYTGQGEQEAEVMESDGDGSGNGFSEKDITGKMNGVIYAVCPINEKVFYVVQVTEYDVEDTPELSGYERLFYLAIKK